jgi:hypothetical protein
MPASKVNHIALANGAVVSLHFTSHFFNRCFQTFWLTTGAKNLRIQVPEQTEPNL